MIDESCHHSPPAIFRSRPKHRYLAGIAFTAAMLAGCTTYGSFPVRTERDGQEIREFRAAREYSGFLIGRYAELSDDPAGAALFYDEALRSGASDPTLLSRAIGAHLAANDAPGALSLARGSDNAQIASSALTGTLLAAEAIRRNNFELAATIAGEGADADLSLRIVKAFALAGAGDKAGAFAALQPPAASERNPAEAFFDLPANPALATVIESYAYAFLAETLGDDARAALDFESALNGPIALFAAAEGRGRALERLERFDEARAFYQEYLGRNPNHVGFRQGAQRLATKGATKPPRPATARSLAQFLTAQAALIQELGGPATALQVLGLARHLDPRAEAIMLSRADALTQTRNYAEARLELGEIPPGSDYFLLARQRAVAILRTEGKPDAALAMARDTKGLAPSYDSNLMVGEALQALDRHAEAEAVFTTLVEGLAEPGPQHWGLFFLRGAARERQDKWDLAEADLRRAVALSPDRALTLNYLGYGLAERGRNLKEAFELIRQAVALDPRSGHIIDSLGWAHYQIGEYEQALDALERAVEIEPGEWEILDHLGDVYWRLGRRIEARFEWKRALGVNIPAAKKPAIEAKLKDGLPERETLARAAVNAPGKGGAGEGGQKTPAVAR